MASCYDKSRMPGTDYSVSGNQTFYHTSAVQGAGHSQITHYRGQDVGQEVKANFDLGQAVNIEILGQDR